MNMDARIIAAQGICTASPSAKLFPWDQLDDAGKERWGLLADGALTALRMAGYVLVPVEVALTAIQDCPPTGPVFRKIQLARVAVAEAAS